MAFALPAEIVNAARICAAASFAAAEMARDLAEDGVEIPYPMDDRFMWESEAFGFGAFVVTLRIRGVRGVWHSQPFKLARPAQIGRRAA